MIPGFSGNLAVAQTTNTLTIQNTNLDGFARQSRPSRRVPEPASVLVGCWVSRAWDLEAGFTERLANSLSKKE